MLKRSFESYSKRHQRRIKKRWKENNSSDNNECSDPSDGATRSSRM